MECIWSQLRSASLKTGALIISKHISSFENIILVEHLTEIFLSDSDKGFSLTAKASVTNAITNCYERRTNDFQTVEIREDNGKTEIHTKLSFIQTFVAVA